MGSCKITEVKNINGELPKLPIENDGPADFQTAIAATKFGKFNIFLLLVAIPSALSINCETGIISFIIPAAACDLELTSSQKGLLNSMSFVGMVLSGFFWGFLLDTLGRKKMIFLGLSAHWMVMLAKSFSWRIDMLCLFQFFGGALAGGVYVAVNTYLHEFHSTEYRGRLQMAYGAMFGTANIIIPLISGSIMALDININLGLIEYYSWNLLFLISGIPPALAALGFYFLPETPKFLMSCGDSESALKVFRQVYRINTGQSEEFYPIKELIHEVTEKEQPSTQHSWLMYIKLGWKQISPLFGKEHRLNLFLVCSTQVILQITLNTARIYSPQVFQAEHDYETTFNSSGTLCEVLSILKKPKLEEGEEFVCSVNLENNFGVYLNSIIIGTATLMSYGMAGTLINTFGRKNLLNVLNITGSISISCLYFSYNNIMTLTLYSIFFGSVGICFDIIITIVVVLFPTTLRAMAFSINLLLGRLLTVGGNLMVPLLVELGCAPPFLTWGSLSLVALLLSCLIPNTEKLDMK
ncbi:putative transporter svop-1 [Sitophilus oryzae]|uniref:Transporter svop-1 n=1 Tax=Sitophilus oryzae TaxID=7048 RepID=A0A6J2X446_SITOR|nr:putative transporter svop-1 [Sitophilus oryzae]